MFALLILGIANLASSITSQKTTDQFKWDSGQISDRMQDTINDYSNVLYGGRAFILNSHSIEPAEWAGYFRSQDAFNLYPGMNNVSYVAVVPAADKPAFVAKMKSLYGSAYNITPVGDRPVYGLASATASSSSMNPSGFDVFSTADRKVVYDQAAASGVPVASGEYEFATGQEGIFVTLPITSNGNLQGYVVISLHSNEFFPAVIRPDKLNNFAVKVTDFTAGNQELYQAGGWKTSSSLLHRSDKISFGGRTWRIDYQAPTNYNQSAIASYLRYFIIGIGILFIAVFGLCFYIFLRMTPPIPLVGKNKEQHTKVVTTTTTTTTE